ncbi:hypothetical protein Rruber_05239 (plasmid) [Rhodococcus ruber]
MTKDEVALLDFAVQWAPYDGGDEHILPEFGLVPTDFYHRLRCLLDTQPRIDAGTRHRLMSLCTRKLGHPPVARQKSMSRGRGR